MISVIQRIYHHPGSEILKRSIIPTPAENMGLIDCTSQKRNPKMQWLSMMSASGS
jgi:hypothetical protein